MHARIEKHQRLLAKMILTLGRTAAALAYACVLATTGCESKPDPAAPPAAKPAKTADGPRNDRTDLREFLGKSRSRDSGELPSGHPSVGTPPPTAGGTLPVGHPAMPGASPATDAKVLKFDAPEAWVAQPVSRPFRKAQYTVPRSGDDTTDGQMIVFYFGKGEGGGVQANLDRWRGMFTTPDGSPVADDAVKVDSFEVNGLKATTLVVSGRYADAMMSPEHAQPSGNTYRMLAAVVETPDGPWFFKTIGPDATLSAHREAFDKMIRSVEW